MRVLESWEDEHGARYAVVWHSPRARARRCVRPFEAMYLVDGELWSFGGAVGYRIADFETATAARAFLLRGFAAQDADPDIWLQMGAVCGHARA